MSYQDEQARGCASYAAVTGGSGVEPGPDYSGRTFEAQGGRCVVLGRETRGAQLWRVCRPDGRVKLMRPSAIAAALQ